LTDLVQEVLLASVSPCYTLAKGALPNRYRLALYGIFAGSMMMAVRTSSQHCPHRSLRFSDKFFSTVVLALLIPVLPDYVNGSGFFAMRMIVLLWLRALAAASGGSFDRCRMQNEHR
jgi:hypothetical protein